MISYIPECTAFLFQGDICLARHLINQFKSGLCRYAAEKAMIKFLISHSLNLSAIFYAGFFSFTYI